MVNVARIVEKHIEEKPFLQEALSQGLINNAALAEKLIPVVEQELKKKVKFSAVNMAIRRLREKLGKSFVSRAKFDINSDILLRSGLVEITLEKSPSAGSIIKKIYEKIDLRKDYIAATQGSEELTIITNVRNENAVKSAAQNGSVKKTIRGLASISVKIPESSVNTMGLFYLTTRALNWENICIVEIVSTLTELVFIIKEEDAPRAFSVLTGLIAKNS